MTASSSTAVAAIRTRPPAGENFTALSRMFARATFAATGAAFTKMSGQRIGDDDHALLLGPRPHGEDGSARRGR